MNLKIRNGGRKDASWIVSRHDKIYREEFGFDDTFATTIERKLDSFLDRKDPFKRLWLAEIEGQTVASTAISRESSEIAFLNFVLVDPKWRGHGIAASMMNMAIDHARKHSYAAIRLETYSCLQGARALYTTLGFTIIEVTANIDKFNQTFDQEFWILNLIRK